MATALSVSGSVRGAIFPAGVDRGTNHALEGQAWCWIVSTREWAHGEYGIEF